MGYGLMADMVVVVHVAFILFVALGGFLAWRWPRVWWVHAPAVVYAVAIVTIGFDCPLTPLEKHLRHLAHEQVYSGGFVRHYLTDVVYPGRLTPYLRALAACSIAVAYAGLLLRRRRTVLRAACVEPSCSPFISHCPSTPRPTTRARRRSRII
jgi:hypothetical protein